MDKKLSHPLLSLLLLVGTFCLLAFHLGTPSLFESSEARYGSVARTMLESGNWIIPEQNGLPHFTKPPLTYWLSALGMKLFGKHETGAKAFLPVVGALTIVAVHQIGLLLLVPRAALFGTFVFMTCALFLGLFRGLTTDPLLTMLETWLIWCLLSHVSHPHKHKPAGFWLLGGLIMLTKGPPGFLPLLGVLPFLWADGTRRNELRSLLIFPPGWGIFLAVGFGWYALVMWKTPGLFGYFLHDEIINRVASDAHQRSAPFYYFVGVFLFGLFPWSPFAVEAIREALIETKRAPVPAISILLLWLIVPFLVLSLSSSKLATYFLPFLVPAALLTGNYLSRALHLGRDEPTAFQLGAGVTVLLLGLLGFSALLVSASGGIPNRLLAEKTTFLGVNLIFISVFCLIFWNLRMAKGIIMAFGLVIPGMLFLLLPNLEGNEEVWSGTFLNGQRMLLKAVADIPADRPILCIEEMLEGIPFYTGRPFSTWEVKRETRFVTPEVAADRVLFGPESLKAVTRFPTYLLMRKKDVAAVSGIIQRRVQPLLGSGFWGLYKTGEQSSQVSPPAISPLTQAASDRSLLPAAPSIPSARFPPAPPANVPGRVGLDVSASSAISSSSSSSIISGTPKTTPPAGKNAKAGKQRL